MVIEYNIVARHCRIYIYSNRGWVNWPFVLIQTDWPFCISGLQILQLITMIYYNIAVCDGAYRVSGPLLADALFGVSSREQQLP